MRPAAMRFGVGIARDWDHRQRMSPRRFQSFLHFGRYLPLWSALVVLRWRNFDRRARGLGTTCAWIMRWFAPAQWRIAGNVMRVFPDISRRDRIALGQAMGREMGQTLFEIYHIAQFHQQYHKFHASGPGLAALKLAQAQGRGAIILSGHFGQWEAVRAVIKMHAMECGAVYRPHRNRHYERRMLAGIKAGGQPILPVGAQGTRELVRHLRAGGIMAILLDEYYGQGAMLPFLGQPARTSLAAAQLALKYDLLLIPAYGIRRADGTGFDVVFEAPIAHDHAETMTGAFNDSLSARIRKDPAQWYWLLRRWAKTS
jgi:Kdo2-lipid IVA lauroyltransferase/acyltransferase